MKKNRNEKFARVKRFILNHRIVFTAVLLVIGVVAIFLLSISYGNRKDLLQDIYSASQIVSAFFVMSGVVIAGWQYFLTSRAEMSRFQLEKVQKSVELSGFYKDNVLNKYSAVKYVYKKVGVIDILQKIKRDDMKEFTYNEMRRLLSEKDIESLKEIEDSAEFLEAILEANTIYNLELHIIKKKIEDGEGKKYLIDKRPILYGFFSDLLSDIMNNLEYFSMYFVHKAAYDSVVFSSLHQTYLEIVQMLYYHISVMNDMKEGTYYTNTIELYGKWYNESINSRPSQTSSKGTVVEDIN